MVATVRTEVRPDLFSVPSSYSGSTRGRPPAYVVPYPIEVNTLTRTLEML